MVSRSSLQDLGAQGSRVTIKTDNIEREHRRWRSRYRNICELVFPNDRFIVNNIFPPVRIIYNRLGRKATGASVEVHVG